MLTEPVFEAVEKSPGLWGAHFTSEFHCCDGISQNVSRDPEWLLQHIRRLSLLHESSKLESIVFHATPRMPLECPAVSLKG